MTAIPGLDPRFWEEVDERHRAGECDAVILGHHFRQLDTTVVPWPNQLGIDDPDSLVVLADDVDDIPGEQNDDGVRAVALIDLARHIVDTYETPAL